MSLAEQVRRKLRITYSDPDTDERVDDIMEQADADLRGLLGIDDDGFSFEFCFSPTAFTNGTMRWTISELTTQRR